jgi:hypothetical protein
MAADQTSLAQESRHPVLAAGQPPRLQLGLHPQGPVRAAALLLDWTHLLGELGGGAAASRRLAPPRPVPARGDTEHPTPPTPPTPPTHRMRGLLPLHNRIDRYRVASVSRAK